MRKLVVTLLLAVSTTGLFAQKLDEVSDKVRKGKYDEAKEKLDKVFQDPKAQTNSEAWFYKAVVYQNLAKAKNDSSMGRQALEAMGNYLQLEKANNKDQRILATLENNKTFFDIYQNYYNNGVNAFKNNDYENALYNFRQSLQTFDYLSKYNLTSMKFDTLSTIYAAYAAQNAKRYSDAAKYYGSIVDIKIPDTSFVNAYEYMISYNLSEAKDTAAAQRYLNIGKQVFPTRNWMGHELAFLSNDKEKRISRLKELTGSYPNDKDIALEYAIDMFNYAFVYEDKPADYDQRKQDTRAAIERLLQLDPNSVMGNYIMSQYYVNEVYDIDQAQRAIRGTTPADQAKKKDLTTKLNAAYEGMNTYSQKTVDYYAAAGNLKAQEKANYRRTLEALVDYYTYKKQTDKANQYQDKLKTLK